MTLQTAIPTKVRQLLQSATADQHQALDSAFVTLDLKNREDYRRFLMAQAAIIAPLEVWLTRHDVAGVLPDWPARRRAEAIAEDLAALGAAAEPDPVDMGPASVPALLGITYVLEGSRLGAHYLARVVSASPDPVVRDNMRFLEHGTGQRLWPLFLQTLEAVLDNDPEGQHRAAEAARRTFDLFIAAQRRHAPVLVKAGA